MIKRYSVVKAKTAEEAVEKSPFFVGQAAKVGLIEACGNSDGTYTVFAQFELTEPKVSDAKVQHRT